MATLKKYLFSIIHSGTQYATHYESAKRIVLSNTISCIFIGLSIPYAILFYILGFKLMGLLVFPCISLFSSSIFLNKWNKAHYSGFSFSVAVSIIIYFYASTFGAPAGIQYMLFALMAATSVVSIHQSYTKLKWLSYVMIIGTYILLELTQYTGIMNYTLPPSMYKIIRISIVLNLFIILLFVINFQIKLADQSKLNLTQFLAIYQLTLRESEIITHLCRGASNKEIGDQLYIEEATVKTHLRNIYRKLNVKNRVEVVSFFLKNNTTHP